VTLLRAVTSVGTMRYLSSVVLASLGLAGPALGTASADIAAPGRTLHGGQRILIPARAVRASQAIICISHGIHVRARPPRPGHGLATIADGLRGSATLELTRRLNGSLLAVCR
jgi:hypothetical protein